MDLNAARSWAVQQFADSLQSVVQEMTSVRPEISWEPADDTVPGDPHQDQLRWWALGFTGFPSVSVWVGAPVTGVSALGRSLIGALGLKDTGAQAARSACRDLFAQTAIALATSMSELFDKPVASEGVTTADAPHGMLAATLVVVLPAVPDAAILTVRCDQDFLSHLAEVLPSPSTPDPSPVGRIADLELSVHATLGRASIPLRDVFKLMVGSEIYIGKTITDPVDVVVNDRVIAHGQVVTCDGVYGVKLTHQLTGTGDSSCRRTD